MPASPPPPPPPPPPPLHRPRLTTGAVQGHSGELHRSQSRPTTSQWRASITPARLLSRDCTQFVEPRPFPPLPWPQKGPPQANSHSLLRQPGIVTSCRFFLPVWQGSQSGARLESSTTGTRRTGRPPLSSDWPVRSHRCGSPLVAAATAGADRERGTCHVCQTVTRPGVRESPEDAATPPASGSPHWLLQSGTPRTCALLRACIRGGFARHQPPNARGHGAGGGALGKGGTPTVLQPRSERGLARCWSPRPGRPRAAFSTRPPNRTTGADRRRRAG